MDKTAMLALLVMLGLLVACHEPATTSGVVTAAAMSSEAQKAQLSGELFYLPRLALPDDAEAEVVLVDVSLADAPSVQLASQQLKPAGQIPIAFVLDYDPAQLVPGHSYAIQARITHQGKLLYITTSRHAVLGNDMATSKLRIQVNPVEHSQGLRPVNSGAAAVADR